MLTEIRDELNRRGIRQDICDEIVGVLSAKNDKVLWVFRLRMDGMTQQNIAKATGIPQQTVSWMLKHKCKRVRGILVKSASQDLYINRGGGD